MTAPGSGVAPEVRQGQDAAMTRLPVALAATAALLLALTGCAAADYTHDEGQQAVDFYTAASDGSVPDPMPAADQARFLSILKKYCEGVKTTSISNMDAAFQPDAATLVEGAAKFYCPSIMTNAKH